MEDIAGKLRRWRGARTIEHAAEVVGASAALGAGAFEEAREAALYLRENESRISRQLFGLTSPWADEDELLTSEVSETPSEAIRIYRRLLLADPRNAIARVDLAREYASLGLVTKALKEIGVALSLNSTNRFILRSSVRFFVHINEIDRASYYLRRVERTRLDPWLLSAEIAISNLLGRTSKWIKGARQLLNSGRYSDRDNAELASALATEELRSGARRRSLQLFRRALQDPTENAVAQAEWAQRRTAISLDLAYHLSSSPSFEARSMSTFYSGDWSDTLEAVKQWRKDEPFSSRPVTLESYIYSTILEDHDQGLQVAMEGYKVNPDDLVLSNNIVFNLVNLGRVKEATLWMPRIDESTADNSGSLALYATFGLLLYRQGLADEGRGYYEIAIRRAIARNNPYEAALAALYRALEEIMSRPEKAEEDVRWALGYANRLNRPDIELISNRVKERWERSQQRLL